MNVGKNLVINCLRKLMYKYWKLAFSKAYFSLGIVVNIGKFCALCYAVSTTQIQLKVLTLI